VLTVNGDVLAQFAIVLSALATVTCCRIPTGLGAQAARVSLVELRKEFTLVRHGFQSLEAGHILCDCLNTCGVVVSMHTLWGFSTRAVLVSMHTLWRFSTRCGVVVSTHT
jgi:hypothetical protein